MSQRCCDECICMRYCCCCVQNYAQNELLISWRSVLNGKPGLNYGSIKEFIILVSYISFEWSTMSSLLPLLHPEHLYFPIKGLYLISIQIYNIYSWSPSMDDNRQNIYIENMHFHQNIVTFIDFTFTFQVKLNEVYPYRFIKRKIERDIESKRMRGSENKRTLQRKTIVNSRNIRKELCIEFSIKGTRSRRQ